MIIEIDVMGICNEKLREIGIEEAGLKVQTVNGLIVCKQTVKITMVQLYKVLTEVVIVFSLLHNIKAYMVVKVQITSVIIFNHVPVDRKILI